MSQITDRPFTTQDRRDLQEFLADYDRYHHPDFGHKPGRTGPDYVKIAWWAITLAAGPFTWWLAWVIFQNWFLY